SVFGLYGGREGGALLGGEGGVGCGLPQTTHKKTPPPATIPTMGSRDDSGCAKSADMAIAAHAAAPPSTTKHVARMATARLPRLRSEERRVGKEGSAGGGQGP